MPPRPTINGQPVSPRVWAMVPEADKRALAGIAGAPAPAAETAPPAPAPARHRPGGWRAVRAALAIPRHPKGYREHTMQAELFAWSQVQSGRLGALRWLFAVPNGGHRNAATAGILRAEGVRRGVPDLLLPVQSAGFVGAAAELKVYPNKPSPKQEQWLDGLEALGWRVALVYSLAEAQQFFAAHLGEQLPLAVTK